MGAMRRACGGVERRTSCPWAQMQAYVTTISNQAAAKQEVMLGTVVELFANDESCSFAANVLSVARCRLGSEESREGGMKRRCRFVGEDDPAHVEAARRTAQ